MSLFLPMHRVQDFLLKHCSGVEASPFVVTFADVLGKKCVHMCYPLTVGSKGYAGGAALDPWCNSEGTCRATDLMSCNGKASFHCDLVEFNMARVMDLELYTPD